MIDKLTKEQDAEKIIVDAEITAQRAEIEELKAKLENKEN